MLSYKDIARLFEEIELRLIASLKRNLTRHKNEERQEGFSWSMWQAEKLRHLESFRRQNKAVMAEYSSLIDSQTGKLMQEQFDEGEQLAAQYEEAGVEQPSFFGINEQRMNSLMSDITTLEKRAETAALRMTDDIYRQTVNRAQLAMAAGEMTLDKAVDMAVEDFLNSGINCIVYKDGRRVNIADYVRMALRTTATRANLQGQAKRYAELGVDTVQISSYSMCSETCEPWQGRAYIDDVFTPWQGETEQRGGEVWGKSNYCGRWFPLLSTAVSKGLFHPNCRHAMLYYKEGISELAPPIPAEELKRLREREQKQRALERNVRKAKRRVVGFSDPDNIRQAQAELKAAQKELREYIAKVNAEEGETVLKRNGAREKVYEGEGVNDSSIDKSGESGIIEEKTEETAETDVHKVGKIDVEKFETIANGRILTDEVIITDNRIEHIIERRGQQFYDDFNGYFPEIIEDPDYIFKDDMDNTAIVSKSYSHKGKTVNLVLRLVVEGENPSYKNSILTAIGENEKRFAQRLRNNAPVYKKS